MIPTPKRSGARKNEKNRIIEGNDMTLIVPLGASNSYYLSISKVSSILSLSH